MDATYARRSLERNKAVLDSTSSQPVSRLRSSTRINESRGQEAEENEEKESRRRRRRRKREDRQDRDGELADVVLVEDYQPDNCRPSSVIEATSSCVVDDVDVKERDYPGYEDGVVVERQINRCQRRRRCTSARRNAMTMDLQRLISEVHARPAIWDQKNVNYHNRDIILRMWREIAKSCEVSTDVAKSKWKHLRDNFRNELKKSYRGKCDGTVNVMASENDSKWVWFKSLFFLRDQMNSRVIGCGMAQNCAALRVSPDGTTHIEPQIDILEGHEETQFDGDVDGDSCQSMPSNEDALHRVMQPPLMAKIGRKRYAEAIDAEYHPGKMRYNVTHKRYLNQEDEEDDTYHFLMSVRNPIRSLPLDRQMFVRLKIQELVFNEINSLNQHCRPYDSVQDVKPPRTANNASNETNDVTNSAAMLQNCTPEGSGEDTTFYN